MIIQLQRNTNQPTPTHYDTEHVYDNLNQMQHIPFTQLLHYDIEPCQHENECVTAVRVTLWHYHTNTGHIVKSIIQHIDAIELVPQAEQPLHQDPLRAYLARENHIAYLLPQHTWFVHPTLRTQPSIQALIKQYKEHASKTKMLTKYNTYRETVNHLGDDINTYMAFVHNQLVMHQQQIKNSTGTHEGIAIMKHVHRLLQHVNALSLDNISMEHPVPATTYISNCFESRMRYTQPSDHTYLEVGSLWCKDKSLVPYEELAPHMRPEHIELIQPTVENITTHNETN